MTGDDSRGRGALPSGAPRAGRLRAAAPAVLAAAALLVLFGCGGSSPDSRAGPLSFHSEVVSLRVEGDTLEVEGWYRMRCDRGEAPVSFLFYPYPQEPGLKMAYTRLVECRSGDAPWRPIPFLERPPMGVRWTVPLDLGDTITVHTVYRQALSAHSATYIVTTTRNWGKPLTRARFEIRLPEGAVPQSFSYPFTLDATANEPVYVYEEEDFWPDHDVTVTWAPR